MKSNLSSEYFWVKQHNLLLYFSSLVLFFIPYGVIFHSADPEGRDRNDFITLSFLIFTSLVIVVTGQIMFDTSYWTVFNHICILGSLLIYFAMVIFIYESKFELINLLIYDVRNMHAILGEVGKALYV